MDPQRRAGDRRDQPDAGGGACDCPDHGPHERAVPMLVVPWMEVVRDPESLKSGVLCLDRELDELQLIGGEFAYWACIPSKTLLRPGEVVHEAIRTEGTGSPSLAFDKAASYRDEMIRHLDDAKQVKGYEDQGVTVFKGDGSL